MKTLKKSCLAVVMVASFQAALPVRLHAEPPSASAEREILPANIIPHHYDLELHPDPRRLAFSGRVRIDIEALTAGGAIILNAKQLSFDSVTLEDGRIGKVELDPVRERAIIRFVGPIAKGSHRLDIRYRGTIGRGTLGFFAMDYKTVSGVDRRLLTTNFEPASERMLMPSWDEPGRKATFSLTVDVPDDQMAVSNMPIVAQRPLVQGLKQVRFATTPLMSTYLLFLAVGDYERIDTTVDGVDVGIVVPKGQAERGRYALAEAARLLRYYNGYFGMTYPLPKLDLVVAPGRIQGGSMENWGSILYSQEHLLFDPETSTEADRQLVFLVVAHEMAHQWFGDLVTMGWWDDLWLNEGFARWMQTKAADDLHPEWRTGLQANWIVEQGMRADAKPSTHPVEMAIRSPAEAELAFDEITYDKGASIVSMIENYVGADDFRSGIRRYLHDHAYRNTVTADLWNALQAASGKPISDIANDFTLRAGLPLISVGMGAGQGGLDLHQSRFEESQSVGDERPWHMPLAIAAGDGGAAFTTFQTRDLHVSVDATREVTIVNAGRRSYLRVRYDPPLHRKLTAAFGRLSPSDQIMLIQDGWALGQTVEAPAADVLDLLQALPADADPIVWREAVRIMVSIDHLYTGLPGQAAYRAWARRLVVPLFGRIGWHASAGEAAGVGLLRGPLLLALGRFGDEQVIADARRIDMAPMSAGSAEEHHSAHEIVARNANPTEFAAMEATLRATHDPLAKLHLLEAMSEVEDPTLVDRFLTLAIGPEAPAGSSANLIVAAAAEHPDQAWRFAQAHLDEPNVMTDRATRMVFIPKIPQMSGDVARIAELRAYAVVKLPPAVARFVDATAAQITLNAKARAHALPQIDAWLNGQH